MAKRKALWLPLPAAPLSIILLITVPEGYGDIALFVLVPCSVLMEWSVHLPDSNLVVPISVAAQGTHRSTYSSKSHSGPRCSLVTPSKWGTAPSGRSFSLYKTSWRNSTRLPDVFN